MSEMTEHTVLDHRVQTRKARRWASGSSVEVFGFVILAVCLLVAILGSVIFPYDPDEFVGVPFAAPSAEHWFGTDELGRDQFSRCLSAMRVAVIVGAGSVGIGMSVGTLIGIIAGYASHGIESLLMRLMDVKFAFPDLVLALVVVAVLGAGMMPATLAIAIVFIPRFARIVRTATRSAAGSAYVHSARLSGVRSPMIMLRHIVPNITTPVVVLAALNFANAQLAYAALAFLGFGARPPQADYGTMLSVGRSYMTFDPWVIVFPALCLALLTVSSNLVGDAVHERLDPRARGVAA